MSSKSLYDRKVLVRAVVSLRAATVAAELMYCSCLHLQNLTSKHFALLHTNRCLRMSETNSAVNIIAKSVSVEVKKRKCKIRAIVYLNCKIRTNIYLNNLYLYFVYNIICVFKYVIYI